MEGEARMRRIAEEWSIGTLGLKLRGQRLEQEIRERERVEYEMRVARTIQQASLPALHQKSPLTVIFGSG
jgi:hypothetical protein